jgi:hypothetical protein
MDGLDPLAHHRAVFWYCLPRGGKTHRLVGIEFESYVAVAFVIAFTVGFCLIFSGFMN